MGGRPLHPVLWQAADAAQKQVHFLCLRRATNWLNRVLDSSQTGTTTAEAWSSFEDNTTSSGLRLVADLVDLPDTAGTCDPTLLLGEELRSRLAEPEGIVPTAPVGHTMHRIPKHSRREYVRLVVRELLLKKPLLRRDASGLGSIFPVPKSGDRQRAVWHGTLVSEASARPPKPRRLGNRSCLLTSD